MEHNFDKFMRLNRELLNCYSQVDPDAYRMFKPNEQKNFCLSERAQVEEMLMKGKVSARDFFDAAKNNEYAKDYN